MLEIRSLSSHFGEVRAVDDLSLKVDEGEFGGIIGRSSAGESTPLRLINRLVDPTAGQILAGGRDVTALKGHELRLWRAQFAMIFQQFSLIERFDVLRNVLVSRIAYHGFITSMAHHFSDAEGTLAILALDRLESKTRSGTILDIVGAGGIGFILSDRIAAYRWYEAWSIIFLIILTVYIIDGMSARLRTRIIGK
ncbi:MAG: ATP-binding cassette domain-containing protein [Pseudomonadota bacterium]